MLIVISSIKK